MQDCLSMQAEQAAHDLNEIRTSIVPIQTDIQAGRTTTSKSTAHQATKVIESLRGYLQEWFDFQPTIQASIDTAYVQHNDLVTVTPLAASPGASSPLLAAHPPFFLGGQPILVASPASSMAQPLKAAVLRGGWDPGGDDQGVAAGGGAVSGALDEMEVLRLRKAPDLSNAALCMRRSCIN
ncbi:unnamed protein product [Clonostachys rosea f. rosea IK726]|uniref:Uncharacterized protein n=1 Tax=Clonostachys rosea f. rosea IK726 TaxID=1349383 RepID=A0ACA9TM66_BIOOC|nr:unnamed protein product [Clonostachys rosea f. rosea IK726]